MSFGTESSSLIIKGSFKIEGCKIEGLLYMNMLFSLQVKSNANQICWLAHKSLLSRQNGGLSFQEFLDTNQYTRDGILGYEKIFGKHFISTGGPDTTKEFVKLLDLKPGQRVLDVGSGIGGSAFYMAKVGLGCIHGRTAA